MVLPGSEKKKSPSLNDCGLSKQTKDRLVERRESCISVQRLTKQRKNSFPRPCWKSVTVTG
jgi:hypothetical protein